MTDTSPSHLSAEVKAVADARDRLGRDLDQLEAEARGQIGSTVEKIAWKAAVAGAAIGSGLIVRKLLAFIWKAARKGSNPPVNPAAPGTQWGEAIGWTFATAAGIAVARLVAERGAAAGWQKATGHLPPGLEDV